MQPHLQQVVQPFLDGVRSALGPGHSVVLYGSAARNEHVEGFSDLNLLVVADDLSPGRLTRLGEALSPLEGRSLTPPLLLTRAEWDRAADAFPVEITDMQLAHVALEGPDPVTGLAVDRAELRSAIERDLRGKLLRLRQGYAVLAHQPEALGGLAVRSAATVGVLLRVALALAGGPAPLPTPETFAEAGRRMRFDAGPATTYFAVRGGAPPSGDGDRFTRYLAAVEIAVGFIDQFDVGGTA
jgi:predicted nucleotidyltransferase